ncbi:MAG: hypothetical protein HQM03_13680 [Magnetococcales bacterium]|nr:hypothetical protein [Magnetococcales bacterium]
MLKSYEAIYDRGQFRWLGPPPDIEQARVIVTVLPPQQTIAHEKPISRPLPSDKIKGSTRIPGDIVASPYSEKEWEAMFERTARQLEGDPEAFK